MASSSLGVIVQQIRHLVGLPADDGSDGQLLRRFASQRDEGAFAALLERHGPMVLGVWRRVRRGLSLSAASLAALLAGGATAAVPAALRQSTCAAALRFAAGQPAAGVASSLATAALQATTSARYKALAALLLGVTLATA